MIVICDTSALSALADLGWLDLLPHLYPHLVIVRSVQRECLHPRAPETLRAWAAGAPPWLAILDDPHPLMPEVGALGAGEAASISLAWERRDQAFLILDDGPARALARALGLPLTGLLGLLVKASALGLIDFESVPSRLESIGFHLSQPLIEKALRQARRLRGTG